MGRNVNRNEHQISPLPCSASHKITVYPNSLLLLPPSSRPPSPSPPQLTLPLFPPLGPSSGVKKRKKDAHGLKCRLGASSSSSSSSSSWCRPLPLPPFFLPPFLPYHHGCRNTDHDRILA